MKHLRKLMAILLLLSMVLSLMACKKKGDAPSEPEGQPTEQTETGDTGKEDVVTKEAFLDDGRLTLSELSSVSLSELTAVEMARVMGIGINLSNTMEACNTNNRVPNLSPTYYEQLWGQPVTTQEIISGMREAGFKSLRIPVAWMNAMDFENGDYTLGEAYLDRVEEIVNYALNADMFVMINDHWDHGWWSMFGHPDQEVRDKAMDMYIAMWTQIAEKFKDYDYRLIFESANEELGDRLNDRTEFSPTGGTLTEDERYEMVRKINQTFVDVVRRTGGYNADRFLLVKGYNTNIDKTVDDRFVMPTDTAKNRLFVGVHYYEPWGYCGDTAGVSAWGTLAEVEKMHSTLAKMKKFTDQGYGVIIGEWGVLDNKGEDRYNYYFNFLNLNEKYGYVPFLWDTGGIYSRREYKIRTDTDDEAISKIISLLKNFDVKTLADMTVEEIVANAEDNLALAIKKAESRPQFTYGDDEAYAWIMLTSGDWAIQYSVGDVYEPGSKPDGLVATDVKIEGPGTYTVALDITGTDQGYANGLKFSAVGIVNAEKLWPGYIIEIKEILINGEPAELSGKPYTTSDDGNTTRVNLYNEWVGSLPPEARTLDGDLSDATPVPLEKYTGTKIQTIQVTFDYIEG